MPKLCPNPVGVSTHFNRLEAVTGLTFLEGARSSGFPLLALDSPIRRNAKKLGLSLVELDEVIHVLNGRREEGLARGARTVPSARRGRVPRGRSRAR